jgi:translation initiation factor IF-3
LPLEQALRLAQEKNLDLILIAERADPPVARILSFDKFRYEKEKELKKQRRQKPPEIKQIQISARTAKNDLLIRIKKLEEFLNAGHRVEIQMVLRGREKSMIDWSKNKLNDFMNLITVPYKITREIKTGGRGLNVQIEPDKK